MSNFVAFRRLHLEDWRQFRSVDIEVHSRLTLITGANGAGKSTILNLFTQHFGVNRVFLSTPKRKNEGGYSYDPGLYKLYRHLLSDDDKEVDNMEAGEIEPPSLPPQGAFIEVDKITYTNFVEATLGFHQQQVGAYRLSIQNPQSVVGVYIGSHRFVPVYQPVQKNPFNPCCQRKLTQLSFKKFKFAPPALFTSFSPTHQMKEALIVMAAFGEGNSHLQANKERLNTFTKFIDVLKVVLPQDFGFQSLIIRPPDVVLKTLSGDFVLDSASGGVNAVIELAWQLHLFSLANNEFAVTIDEPENHPHPSMQRSIIPNLMTAFPKAQFIVATHSSFIVSAVEDSAVYVLLSDTDKVLPSGDSFNQVGRRRVISAELTGLHKAGSASEILREVLGVPVTVPDWVQSKIDNLVAKHKEKLFSTDTLRELRSDLAGQGFGESYPEALSQLVKTVNKAE